MEICILNNYLLCLILINLRNCKKVTKLINIPCSILIYLGLRFFFQIIIYTLITFIQLSSKLKNH